MLVKAQPIGARGVRSRWTWSGLRLGVFLLGHPGSCRIDMGRCQPGPALNDAIPVLSRIDTGQNRFNRQSRTNENRSTSEHLRVAMHKWRARRVHCSRLAKRFDILPIDGYTVANNLDEHCSPAPLPDEALNSVSGQGDFHLVAGLLAAQDFGKEWGVHEGIRPAGALRAQRMRAKEGSEPAPNATEPRRNRSTGSEVLA